MIEQIIVYELRCDICGDPPENSEIYVLVFRDQEEAGQYAEQHGWRITNHFGWVEHVCPECLGPDISANDPCDDANYHSWPQSGIVTAPKGAGDSERDREA